MRRSFLLLAFIACVRLSAQVDTAMIPNSANGWHLSPHGTIRVLVLFAEIEYDVNPTKDPASPTAEHWPKGQLPKWKDDVFDPQLRPMPQAMVTRYYHDISLGQFEVLGDYVDQMLTLRESEYRTVNNAHGIGTLAVQEANKMGILRTHSGLGIADFDLWKRGGKPGLPKEAGADDPHSYDHVMVIVRNSGLTHGQGSTDGGSPGKLFGFESDSQSRFGGMNALPFEILKHEFNHLLFGGNNFHSGGGNAAQFTSYFLSLQGGHSMMGAAGSALLTCSAWDRDRLGWKARDATFRINARHTDGTIADGDLDPLAGDTGVFVLRDFVTTGDALRIRLPFLEEGTYPQWIWLENHQGSKRNGSPTDRFHWEGIPGIDCIAPMVPGITATIQVDREERTGKDIYGGYADYLRPLPANGLYDFDMLGDTVSQCPFVPNRTQLYRLDERRANPLTGNHELELPLFDRDGNGKLQRGEHFVPYARMENGVFRAIAQLFGRPEHLFRLSGNHKLGMGTNPGTSNALTLVSSGNADTFNGGPPNDRVIHLNGISVEILSENANGATSLRVRTGDTYIDHDLRWCGDSIVLHDIPNGHHGRSLCVAAGHSLIIDRSETATRLDRPEKVGGITYFGQPTHFTVASNASALIERKGKLDLRNGTVMHLMPGSTLELEAGVKLSADASSRIVLHGTARIKATTKQLKKLKRKGRLIVMPQ
ncbi:MAG: hypothetical protein ABI432_05155 [Flavobacteriales bacterium]